MLSLIRSELFRIWLRKSTIILIILCIILSILACIFYKYYNVGFYDSNNSLMSSINNLNISIFVISEVHLFLAIIVLPVLCAESINHEIHTGTFRMIAVKPYGMYYFIISKWISIMITISIFIISVFVVANIIGHFLLPHTSYVQYFNIQENYNYIQSLLYSIKFYALEFVILTAIAAISSAVCIVTPNSVLSVISSLGILIVFIYISKKTMFIIQSKPFIFDVLADVSSEISIYFLIGFIFVGLGLSCVFWHKKINC